jgi:hypothetical protein
VEPEIRNCGFGTVDLESSNWHCGTGARELELTLDFWTWISETGIGFLELELELLIRNCGTGARELDSGTGTVELELWTWNCGTGTV